LALSIRLEGALETLEAVADGCEVLAALLQDGWRQQLVHDRAVALAPLLLRLPAAIGRVAALRDRVTRAEQRELERLVRNAQRAGRQLEERVDAVLRASAAEMSTSLDRKLLRVGELERDAQLDRGELVLHDEAATLRPTVQGRWWPSQATVKGERVARGRLRLTQHRLLYDDSARRIEVPLRGLEIERGDDGAVVTAGSARFEVTDSRLDTPRLLLAMLRRFPPREAQAVQHALISTERLTDGVSGWLLAWPGGVLFAPKRGALELLEALNVDRSAVVAPDAFRLLEAVSAVLPWAGRDVLGAMARSTWNWSWPREEIVIDSTHELAHRSGDDYQPRYRGSAAVSEVLSTRA
jgi:hypothetical protein